MRVEWITDDIGVGFDECGMPVAIIMPIRKPDTEMHDLEDDGAGGGGDSGAGGGGYIPPQGDVFADPFDATFASATIPVTGDVDSLVASVFPELTDQFRKACLRARVH
jgi:hypothetical protein